MKLCFYACCLVLAVLILASSCKKEESATIPTLTTADITDITQGSAISGGEITSDGGAAILMRGVCWSTNQTPTVDDQKTEDGTGLGSFTSNISGLASSTTYFVRAYATNSVGTGYGASLSLTTLEEVLGVTDIDGNFYPTVSIGNQVWMAKNLQVTTYNNGTPIPNVTSNSQWSSLSSDAYCWVNNDESSADTQGALYNWNAVIKGNLCPAGWHVPSSDDWVTLVDYIASQGHAGNEAFALKAQTGWDEGGNGADIYGFTALPYGNRTSYDGAFENQGILGYWWTSSEHSNNCCAYFNYMSSINHQVNPYYSFKNYGFSVRCVKDSY